MSRLLSICHKVHLPGTTDVKRMIITCLYEFCWSIFHKFQMIMNDNILKMFIRTSSISQHRTRYIDTKWLSHYLKYLVLRICNSFELMKICIQMYNKQVLRLLWINLACSETPIYGCTVWFLNLFSFDWKIIQGDLKLFRNIVDKD